MLSQRLGAQVFLVGWWGNGSVLLSHTVTFNLCGILNNTEVEYLLPLPFYLSICTVGRSTDSCEGRNQFLIVTFEFFTIVAHLMVHAILLRKINIHMIHKCLCKESYNIVPHFLCIVYNWSNYNKASYVLRVDPSCYIGAINIWNKLYFHNITIVYSQNWTQIRTLLDLNYLT